ncbi:LAMI_0C03862g1_1 [Lachancea mirantina]|uniref:LAMI_0C03862g1_1 n=1 Tax=Lachancea mirantina TaxID=1230905 RepID=A0A1G4J2E9_9SACH|nr:LAMI_0C03862g1_1 [Lachancea mirantina]
MSSSAEVIASFSPDASSFVFRLNGFQKRLVNLYPLNSAQDYKVTSSQIFHIDYEQQDLDLTEVKFFEWCVTPGAASGIKSKRKLNDTDAGTRPSQAESHFVNIFPGGKVVIFSSTGSDIFNIIQTKKEIVGAATLGSKLWILDEQNTVKEFNIWATKASKSFSLGDIDCESLSNFQVLQFGKNVYLIVIVESRVHVWDISPKKKPSKMCHIEIFGGIAATSLNQDTSLMALVDVQKLSVIDLKTSEIVTSWDIEATQVKSVGSFIVALCIDNTISVYEYGKDEPMCSIKCKNSEILDFSSVNDDLLLAWLNVNEPQFELVTAKEIRTRGLISFSAESNSIESEHGLASSSHSQPEKGRDVRHKTPEMKGSQALNLIIKALNSNAASETILQLISMDSLSESHIQSAITKTLSEENLIKVYHIVSDQFVRDPWSCNSTSATWLKWLLTTKRSLILQRQDRASTKRTKQLRSSLKCTSSSYRLLLSMQGKLEMLREQANLRQQIANMALEEGDVPNGDDAADESALVYVNGEGDEFVDALEYSS